MSLHDAHRERIRDRVRRNGLESFTDIQVLELLLFYTIPRADTNETAHRLLKRFGSLTNVLNAPEKELMAVEGVGERSAFFLRLVPQVVRFYQKQSNESVKIVDSASVYVEYLKNQFAELHDETVYLLCMDARKKILGCEIIGVGTVNSANAPMRRILEVAIRLNASMAVLAHNHPSGVALPSRDDVQMTHYVASMLQNVDVILVDHVIIAGDDGISMAQSGLFNPKEYQCK